MKALLRWAHVPEHVLTRLLSALFSLHVEAFRTRVRPASGFAAMLRVAEVTDALEPYIRRARATRILARLIGEDEAASNALRRLSFHEIFPHVRPALAAVETLGGKIPVVWSPDWPESWVETVAATTEAWGLAFVRWPRWYRKAYGAAWHLGWSVLKIASIVGSLARQRRRPPAQRRLVPVLVEVVEEARMKGTQEDANFWEDGVLLGREDVQYFFTRAQRAQLGRGGVDVNAMLGRLRAVGHAIVDLREIGYGPEARETLRQTLREVLRAALDGDAPCLDRASWYGLDAYAQYRLLFDSFAPANVLFTQNPNGNTGPRLDSGVMTGLCRRYGARAVGYQNRCVYGPIYEDSYDCYDTYLAWSPAWPAALGRGARFLGPCLPVGCLHNDGLAHGPRRRVSGEPIVISVFTVSWFDELSAPETTLEMLRTCLALAERHPNCRFQVKTKDPDMVAKISADPTVAERSARVGDRFRFIEGPRYGCAAVVAESDIVIAIAFTTPGADALLLGRRVIFYRATGAGGGALSSLPDLIADDPAELDRLFEIALADFAGYAKSHEATLRTLDPFRDGRVRSRVAEFLTAAGARPSTAAQGS
ncbi:MAG: hypothetical protein AABZ30_15660, partial [Myxococcota bacterium]